MPKLFVVYLGGSKEKGRMGEDHEVVFTVAGSQDEAKEKSRNKWRGVGKAHVDAVLEVKAVDGFDITLVRSGALEDLLEECANDYSK